MMGRDSLSSNYTVTSVTFQTAIAALNRLVDEGGPFLLSLQVGPPVRISDCWQQTQPCCKFSFRDPSNLSAVTTRLQHPPYVSSGEYMNQYFNNRDHLFVSPSIRDTMKTSAYYRPNPNMAYQDESRMAELVGTF
jgi:hypothetical protein